MEYVHQYHVIDSQTGQRVTQATFSLKAASRKCERMNQTYGAVRYMYRSIG
jgi:hypothetical protein